MTRLIETLALWTPAALMALLVAFLLEAGWDRLSLDLLIEAPSAQGRNGGLAPILANTGLIVVSALFLAIPISLAAALASLIISAGGSSGWIDQALRRVLELGYGIPRILWGLAGAVMFVGFLGLGLSAAAGILTLACMAIPILVTGFLDGLEAAGRRIAPSCRALGYSEVRLWVLEVLPASRSTIVAAILMALSRALGDAAALMLTAGFGLGLIEGFDNAGSTLATHIFYLIEVGGGYPSAAAAALVLLALSALVQTPFLFGSAGGRRDRQSK